MVGGGVRLSRSCCSFTLCDRLLVGLPSYELWSSLKLNSLLSLPRLASLPWLSSVEPRARGCTPSASTVITGNGPPLKGEEGEEVVVEAEVEGDMLEDEGWELVRRSGEEKLVVEEEEEEQQEEEEEE